MSDGVEVEVWMHGTQGCLVACVRTEPGTEKGVQTHQTQPDVTSDYRTHRTRRTQSPHYESQNATPPHLTQDSFLLMWFRYWIKACHNRSFWFALIKIYFLVESTCSTCIQYLQFVK